MGQVFTFALSVPMQGKCRVFVLMAKMAVPDCWGKLSWFYQLTFSTEQKVKVPAIPWWGVWLQMTGALCSSVLSLQMLNRFLANMKVCTVRFLNFWTPANFAVKKKQTKWFYHDVIPPKDVVGCKQRKP